MATNLKRMLTTHLQYLEDKGFGNFIAFSSTIYFVPYEGSQKLFFSELCKFLDNKNIDFSLTFMPDGVYTDGMGLEFEISE